MSGKVIRSTAASGSQIYESARAVSEYVQFHFGDVKDLMPYSFGPTEALQFTQRTALECMRHASHKRSVLDVGCAVGGASFELTRYFDRVVGIDFSQHFIESANRMKDTRSLDYEMMKQGDIFVKRTAVLDSDVKTDSVTFLVGDACNLDTSLGTFDAIHACNLLCRLPKPRKFLSDVSGLLNQQGILVLVSPYSWLEEYTPKDQWIGGLLDREGSSLDSDKEVHRILSAEFELVDRKDVSFLIREHERKFQYGVSDMQVWRKL